MEGRELYGRGSSGLGGGRERGAATLWGVAFAGVLMAMAMAIVYVGMARVARHRAQSAADLSALAAARLSVHGPERACARAGLSASANHAVLERCSVEGMIAEVQVSVRFALPGVGERRVMSRARAGPVHQVPEGAIPPRSG
ncbi:Rv3654c family TadE-like protein [Spongiactinospora sp. TRM90649]|uniref:Rv3654c family TadE-like protein n=1 Tax=Spongiactinospora sp. TRM90649 TaxID=3031114 RepID=UPI0023F70CA8|nr:Rv3654c family TadE-like protein [Spongiactinospora sp. TRM90649]MDF5754871.1 flp pilus-assembly TadE/G-like family protein [Spongiactinospora sp. TRM90649]